MTIVLTGTLTCWRHASNDNIVCAVSGQWETRSPSFTCMYSTAVYYHCTHMCTTPMKTHAQSTPFTAAPKQGVLSWLKHVEYTVLWYQLEGGRKSCQYFHYPVFFRAKTGEAWLYRWKDFHTPSSWYQRAVYLTRQEQQCRWWAQLVWSDLHHIPPSGQIAQHPHNLQDSITYIYLTPFEQFLHQDNAHVTFYLIIRIQVRWTPPQMS